MTLLDKAQDNDLAQRWCDAQVAAFDASQKDQYDEARRQLSIAEDIEAQLRLRGRDIKDIICP